MAKMVGAGKFKGESHTRLSCMNNLLVALKCEPSLFYREVRLMASTFIQTVRKYVVNIYRLRSEWSNDEKCLRSEMNYTV